MDFVRKRKINLPLGVFGAVLLAAFVYLYVYVYVMLIRMSSNYVSYIIGFLGVMFFATIPIVIITRYMLGDHPEQKVLSIDESGIKLHIGDGCEFSWHEIQSIHKIIIGNKQCLTLSINVHDGRGKPIDIRRKGNILYLPKEVGGDGDISILFQGISPGLDDAIMEVHKHYSGAIKEVVH